MLGLVSWVFSFSFSLSDLISSLLSSFLPPFGFDLIPIPFHPYPPPVSSHPSTQSTPRKGIKPKLTPLPSRRRPHPPPNLVQTPRGLDPHPLHQPHGSLPRPKIRLSTNALARTPPIHLPQPNPRPHNKHRLRARPRGPKRRLGLLRGERGRGELNPSGGFGLRSARD